MTKQDKESQDTFMSDKKESISLVIYQIGQMDKSLTSLAERLDVITVRMEGRLNNLEIWKAGFNQKIATQDQLDSLRQDMDSYKKIAWLVGGLIVTTVVGSILKLVIIG